MGAFASPKTLGEAGKEVNPEAKLREHPQNAENPEPAKAPIPGASAEGSLRKANSYPTSAALGMRGQKRAVKSQRSRGTKSGLVNSQREKLRVSRGCWHLVRTPPSAPLTLQEASTQWPTGPGERGRKDLSFTLTYLQASSSRKAEDGEERGTVVSLPGSAPTVSTLAIGNNPERVSKARRNSDIVLAR